ncbi:MAG: N-acetyltransferase [Gammaproteobacteria bacterium]
MSAALDIRAVSDRRSTNDFVRVPWALYGDDPQWVPPLLFERKEALAPKQPVFEHVEWQGWVGYRDGRPVARISAQVDRQHLERYQDKTGFFGFLEAPDLTADFAALFATAEAWLRDRGMERVRGPFSFNINQEVGLLVEGFDSPPFFMMTHALPYYGPQVERCGFHKAVDLFAYLIDAHFAPPPVMASLFERLRRRINIRPLDRKHLDRDLDIVRDIFNDAWAENWGFVPFTENEFRTIGHEMLLLVPPNFIQIAEMDGEPVAFIVLLPNVNEAIADLDGRLLPTGWLKLVRRLKFGYPRTARIPLMGVRRRFHHTRLGPGLALSVVEALREPGISKGLEEVEMSWILESNEAMKNIIDTLGGRQSKRYRIYEKTLT